MQNNIHKNSKGIIEGIHLCREAVEGTIGGNGKNAIIAQPYYPYYIKTKDAFSIIQSLDSTDPLHKLSFHLMKDATDSMNKKSKDGRTTMCILTDELCQRFQDFKGDLDKEFNTILPIIESEIDKQTKPITVNEVESVAKTASDSERLGKLIASVYKEHGADVVFNHIEGSGTLEDYVVMSLGVKFKDTGLLTPAMVHDDEAKKAGRTEKKAVYENPAILVTKRKISKDEDIDPLISTLIQQGRKDLVIFTDDMDSQVATNLVNTHKAGLMNICVIKAPIMFKNYIFEDFAKTVGATILEDATGITFKNLGLHHLGTCDKIVVDAEDTVITGGADLTEHIADLKQRGDNDSLLRVHWLSTKTATIKLGATNEGELSFMRLKCEDAIHSSNLALQYGVVQGGGLCLYKIADSIHDERLKEVFKAPLLQIARNMNSGKPHDIPDNIVDASMVVKNAVRNAIGIALIALTTDTFIDQPIKSFEDKQLELLSAKQRPF